MASSTGSLETSGNSLTANFSFSSPFPTSFADLLTGAGDDDNGSRASMGGARGHVGIPKFKSLPPPSLPLSPPPFSPSSYFAIPAGLSPADLLDSPVLLSSSHMLPSPTTGTFPSHAFNWKFNHNYIEGLKEQSSAAFSDFSFQTHAKNSANPQASSFQPSSEQDFKGPQQSWSYQQQSNNDNEFPSQSFVVKPEPVASNSIEQRGNNGGPQSEYGHSNQPAQILREPRKSDDGYNWRKYGQKQVKGSENPRSYYKCTYPNCPTKKKVERSLEGQITEIVYKGTHNHPKPQSTRRNSSQTQAIHAPAPSEASDQSFGRRSGTPIDSVATPDNSSVSFGEEEVDMSTQKSLPRTNEYNEDESESKRWKKENEIEGISASGNRTVREPRVVVQTTSDIDILDDGFRWRKYGQKVVKGNPNPRSYYKCTTTGCTVRKHVERASHDLRAVITTYEGKHNHDVPAARGSGGHMLSRPSTNNNIATAIRPSAVSNHSNQNTANAFLGQRSNATSQNQAPFTLQMLQNPGNHGFPEYENPMPSYMNPQQQQQQQKNMDGVYSNAKEEPKDDSFLESLLC